ncbi:hypothetical protein C6502_00555 [Candidatus Poribacteria bacterium]|nr:MAG: hypothetical protein C6502_00555 [Candidatus Poribacteria bacterium]
MIEPTDASKCDERQVKNKPNSLTKKKKGETRRMNSKSMKHWKMAALFVVGLMAMAGWFAGEATAQTATVSVSPPSVESGTTAPTVRVTYTLETGDTDTTTPNIVENHAVSIALPTGLAVSGTTFSTTLGKTDADGNPYVSISGSAVSAFPAAGATGAPEVAAATGTFTVTADWRVNRRLTVTYHNVPIAELSESQLQNRDTAVNLGFTISGATTITPAALEIGVTHPTLSDIRVRPQDVPEKSTKKITVTYEVRHPELMANKVDIALPSGLTDTTFTATTANLYEGDLYPRQKSATDSTILFRPEENANTTPYVTWTDTVDALLSLIGQPTGTTLPTDTVAPSLTANGHFSVTGNMKFGEEINVIYHNVVINELPTPVDPRTKIRDDLVGYIVVSDSKVSPIPSGGTAGEDSGAAYAADSYKEYLRITTTATALSAVDVTPDPVKGGSVEDMTVTYKSMDTVYDNEITIKLPDDWAPAYPESAPTFGTDALKTAPTTGAATTSYVVVGKGYDLVESGTFHITASDNWKLVLDLKDDMSNRETIEVTYHNVMVPELDRSQLLARDTPVMAQFTVTDTITGSDYEDDTQVTVAHPDLSDIQVTPRKPVKEDSIINMTVTYTAKDIIYTTNEIFIRIPLGWKPAHPEASAIFVDEEDVSAADRATTSYVKITERLSGKKSDGSKSELNIDDITADGVEMTVNGNMNNGDRIIVSFYNVKVQPLDDRTPVEADIRVTDKLADDGKAYEGMAQITVNPQELNTVTVKPTRVQASSIEKDVTVTYVITDTIADSNDITIALPSDWEAAYANDGDPDGVASFHGSFDKSIDLAATAASTTATKGMISTKPATLATGASATKTSYVTVKYTPRGTSRTNTATVTINGNEVTIPVKGDMEPRDKIVVMYHNVEIPSLSDREPLDVYITVTDALSVTDDEYNEQTKVRVNPPPLNVVAVTPPTATAETVRDVKVTYSIKDTVREENTITVGLPENWTPAYLPNDGSRPSKSFGRLIEPSVPSADRNTTSYIVVTSTLDDSEDNSEYTVSPITNPEADASIIIEVENTAAKGDRIVVTFHNVKVRGLETGDTVPAKDMLTVTDTIAGGQDFAADEDTMDDVTIAVSALERGSISRLPREVDAEDVLDLRIRYTATEDLADPDPDGDEDTDDATYGRIQIMLPDGWTRMDGAALSDADIAVNGSPNVKFLDPDDDLTTKDHIDVTGQMVTIDVDSLAKGKYVELVVDDLRVADFPDGNTTDELYVQVKVFSDSFDNEADRDVELAVPAAHLLSRVAPTVPIATSKLASAAHPTILVNRKYLGEVTVSPGSVVAERMEDLKIRYTATNNLATRDPAATATDDKSSTYGRIQIALPEGWGPADDGEIHLSRQTDNRNATYLEVKNSSAVTRVDLTADSIISTSDGYRINIDVNAMRERQWVELTVHNLMIAPLAAERVGSFEDIAATAASEKVQVEVFSDTFADMDERDSAPELESPSAHSPVKGKFKPPDAASTTQPTVTVTRKELGAVAIGPVAKVPAGSAQKFTITYTASETLVKDSVIEVRLPNWSTVPTAYQLDDDPIPAADDKGPHVYLGGSKSRLAGSTVSVEEDGDTSIVRITLGDRGLAKNNSIVLKWEGVTVQREIQATVPIPVFSSDSVDLGVPQYPVAKQADDKIEVIHAASGSGMVTFEFDGVMVKKLAGAIKPNTDASVPASLTKDDNRDLIITYTPEGDMIGDKVEAQFEITLPSGWNMESHRASVDDKYVTKSGNTITATLRDRFGENDGDNLEIVLESITTPDDHGNDRFVARSKNANDGFKQLSPIPEVFVGNTLADNDTVSVKITPEAAYEGEEDIDFVITVTANGPMHDSDIKITVPDGITGIKLGKATDDNSVRKVSPPGVTVGVRSDDADDENIFINTGNLNKNGTIVVRLDNVDISGVSTDSALGFRVYTRTRGTDGDTTDDDNLSDVAFAKIEQTDGKRSIDGGVIRTVAGNGMLAIRPDTVQQGTRQSFTLTFTATTKFDNKPLVIVVPSVIETDLLKTTHVTASGGSYHSDTKAADRLVVSNNTITINGLNLRKSERLTIRVNNVNLSEDTGDFTWATTLAGTDITAADENANPPMVVVGTMQDDVDFEIVDITGAPISAPEYHAASMRSIRFRFTAVNTVIQAGGTLRFTIPTGWTAPSTTDTANRATVSIVHLDDDNAETFVATVADKWTLTTRGRRDVILTIAPKGKLGIGESVTIRYGTADLTKYPVVISNSARGTSASDEDGLSIKGSYRVATDFSERDAGRVWVDITNVKDGTGTATVSPDIVRAGSTNNLIRVVYTAVGTMNGGAVRLTIPETWGAAQNDDNKQPNYIKVTATGGGVLTDYEVLDNGRSIQANLKTFSNGSKVEFAYGGSANKGAVAQADIGEVTFAVESRGSSDGTFTPIDTSPTIEVKGAKSGSGDVVLAKTQTKSADGVINAGDGKIHLTITYTAEQTIGTGELELIVPNGWSPPQQDDTNKPGYTEIDEGNALVSDEKYVGQTVTATIEDMEQGDTIKIQYGWYDTENGGAVAPDAAGSYVFRVEFDGVGVASQPMVIVHGGTASKLMVTATPNEVSADPGAMPVAITVEIQDDTGAAAVLADDLEVTLSSTNSTTGSFTDADGDAIAGNRVTISAGSTQATANYSDTGAGTTATVRAMAVGLDSGKATIEVTSDIDTVDANSISVSLATAKAGDSVMVTASGTAGKTATFSVGAVVTTMAMTESPAGSGSYSGSFNVVQDQHDGTHNVTVNIGNASAMVANAITVDTSAPTVSGVSASPATVGSGDMVTISAVVTGDATSVMANVSLLDIGAASVSLADDGTGTNTYTGTHTISADNIQPNGAYEISVTAMDAVGNSGMGSTSVNLLNTLSFTSMLEGGTVTLFHVPLDVEGLDTVGDLKAKLGGDANVSLLAGVFDGAWNFAGDDLAITADLGLLVNVREDTSVEFEGRPWGNGASMINLKGGGLNLVGLPLDVAGITNVSDIMGLSNAITGITVLSEGRYQLVTAAGDPADGPVAGDVGYLVLAATDDTISVMGSGWSNESGTAAPIAIAGYRVDNQTPALAVYGSVVDEITGLAREGFRVKVKNLSTKAALSEVTSAETTDGYDMIFVDLTDAHAARVGDVLEISADSPDPLVGVQPVRHVVTVDDVKNSTIQLENLIAYEIPAETELLRNYPNPFNPETWIPYHLSEDADVKLTIYDVNGEVVRDIDVGHQTAAKYDTRSKAIYWDGRNRFGEQVASGIYFYHLQAGDFSGTRKMVILK